MGLALVYLWELGLVAVLVGPSQEVGLANELVDQSVPTLEAELEHLLVDLSVPTLEVELEHLLVDLSALVLVLVY